MERKWIETLLPGGRKGTHRPLVVARSAAACTCSNGARAAAIAYLDLALNISSPMSPNFGNGLSGNQNAVGNALIKLLRRGGRHFLSVHGKLTPGALTRVFGETAASSQQTTSDEMS
jgi:hypothetical protein